MKKTKIIRVAIILSLSLFVYACNNVGYEIETSDEGGQTGNTTNNDNPNQQVIKNTTPEDNSNTATENNNESPKQIPVKTYSIQIGAFTNEVSAQKFSDKAKASLNIEINALNIGGWIKVKAGLFNSITDAEAELEKVRAEGYPDSFISETGK